MAYPYPPQQDYQNYRPSGPGYAPQQDYAPYQPDYRQPYPNSGSLPGPGGYGPPPVSDYRGGGGGGGGGYSHPPPQRDFNRGPSYGGGGRGGGHRNNQGPPPMSGDDSGEEVRTLFVSGLPHDVQDREIYNLFRVFPGFEEGYVVRNPSKPHPIAFAIFQSKQACAAPMEFLTGTRFDPDSTIVLIVNFAHRNMKPKPPGGDRGGFAGNDFRQDHRGGGGGGDYGRGGFSGGRGGGFRGGFGGGGGGEYRGRGGFRGGGGGARGTGYRGGFSNRYNDDGPRGGDDGRRDGGETEGQTEDSNNAAVIVEGVDAFGEIQGLDDLGVRTEPDSELEHSDSKRSKFE